MQQMFPLKDGMKRWSIDVDAASRLGVSAPRLTAEAGEMAKAFPRWLLTVADGAKLQHCERCAGLVIFDRGLRCVVCDAVQKPAGRLAWFGLLPPIGIDGLE